MINTDTQVSAKGSHAITTRIGTLVADATRLHKAGCWNQAAPLYRQILALDPWHSESLHRWGVIAARAGDHDGAVDMIRKAITQEAQVGAYHLDLGRVLHESGRLDEAVASYRAAIVCQPDLVEAHASVGIPLEEAGQLEAAIYHHRAAIELKPDIAKFYFNLANTLRRLGQLDQAIACHCRAIELEPQFVEA
jgi:tetratricopeptide (TPR) repeat protein